MTTSETVEDMESRIIELIARNGELHAVLWRFHEAFQNRGETTSIKVWNERMEEIDRIAAEILGPHEG